MDKRRELCAVDASFPAKSTPVLAFHSWRRIDEYKPDSPIKIYASVICGPVVCFGQFGRSENPVRFASWIGAWTRVRLLREQKGYTTPDKRTEPSMTLRHGGSFCVSGGGDGRPKKTLHLRNLLVGSAIRVLVGFSQQNSKANPHRAVIYSEEWRLYFVVR